MNYVDPIIATATALIVVFFKDWLFNKKSIQARIEVLISNHIEHRLATIEERLGRIETLLMK